MLCSFIFVGFLAQDELETKVRSAVENFEVAFWINQDASIPFAGKRTTSSPKDYQQAHERTKGDHH